MKFVKMACLSLMLCGWLTVPVYSQPARLQISNIDKLASKAAEIVDVTLDESLLQLASKFLSAKRSPNEAKVKELISDLKGVYVKRFEFDKEGEYSLADIEPIRAQLRAPGWARIVGVQSRRDLKNVEVFLMTEANTIKGIAVLAAEPKELTVVNIIGPIDIEKLSELEGQLGIPRLELERSEKGKQP